MIRALTQYDMKNALERKVSPFYSASLGSIQAALKKLEAGGHIVCEQGPQGGRRKKLYSVTAEGMAHFLRWMEADSSPSRMEQEAATKVFFLGHVAPHERIAIVRRIAGQLDDTVRQYEAASEEARNMTISPQLGQIAAFQLATLDLGLQHYRSLRQWFHTFLKEMEMNPHENGNL